MSETSAAAASPSAPRICFLAPSYYPAIGGGESHARLLARELAARGCDVTVLTRRRDRAWPLRETFEGVHIRRFGPAGFVRLGKYLLLPPALLWLLRHRARYDLIYVCGLRVAGWAGILAQRWGGRPCILRAEACGEMDGGFIWRTPEGTVSSGKKFFASPLLALRNRLYRRAAAFLAVSTPIRQEYLDCRISEARIAEIPNGYDPARFHPLTTAPSSSAVDSAASSARDDLRCRLSLPAAAPLFAYSGKLIRGKGLEHLLRVWVRFHATHPEAHLLLIGSGGAQSLSCENDLRRTVARHELTDTVHFTGYVQNVTDYLQAADAFLFPSERESQGLAVLEAMACALPVVASDIPGIRDMIRPGIDGLLLPPTDESAWLAAMNELLDDPAAARRRALVAAQTARNRYAIPAIAERHLHLFRDLLSAR